MMISANSLGLLISVACIVTAAAPLVLLILWIKDFLAKRLW